MAVKLQLMVLDVLVVLHSRQMFSAEGFEIICYQRLNISKMLAHLLNMTQLREDMLLQIQ